MADPLENYRGSISVGLSDEQISGLQEIQELDNTNLAEQILNACHRYIDRRHIDPQLQDDMRTAYAILEKEKAAGDVPAEPAKPNAETAESIASTESAELEERRRRVTLRMPKYTFAGILAVTILDNTLDRTENATPADVIRTAIDDYTAERRHAPDFDEALDATRQRAAEVVQDLLEQARNREPKQPE